MSDIVGGCSKHPGNNMVNCPLCEIDKINKERLEDLEYLNSLNFSTTKNAPIDKNGCCPNCNTTWDGGDIYESLYKLDIFMQKSSEEVKKHANQFYGWTPENAKRFSNVIGITISRLGDQVNYYQCPNCLHVFDADTGKEFINLNEARNYQYE